VGERWGDVDEEAAVRFSIALRRGYREATSGMGRVLAAHQLSQLEYHLLLELAGVASGVGQSALARDLQAPKTRISILVRGLQQRGLVESVRPERDRRQVWVRITSEGLRRLHEARRAVQDSLIRYVASFPREDVARMLEQAVQIYLAMDVRVTLMDRVRTP
jgi:DNA-binding MarR family transcriptional regulator